MRRGLFPIVKSPRILVPVALRDRFRVNSHRDADFRKIAEEIEMPIHHGHLQAIRKPYAGCFADLIAPAILQHAQDNHHHNGKNDHAGRKSPLFDH